MWGLLVIVMCLNFTIATEKEEPSAVSAPEEGITYVTHQ